MTSEFCVGGALPILGIKNPGDVTALDRVVVWRLNSSGEDTQRIGSDEFVESRQVKVCMDRSEIHDLKAAG